MLVTRALATQSDYETLKTML